MLARSSIPPILALIFSLACATQAAVPVTTLRIHQAEVTCVTWSNDGETIASGDKQGVVILTDAHSRTTRLRFRYGQAVTSLAFSPDSKQLAVGRGHEIRLLNAETGSPVRIFKLQKTAGKDLAFSSNGKLLMGVEGQIYSSEEDSRYFVDVWQLPSGNRLRHWSRTKEEELTAALASNGTSVAIATVGHVELWSIATGKRVRGWEDNTEKEWPFITALAFASDSGSVAGSGSYFEAAGHFAHWNVSGKVRGFDSFQDYAAALAFSPHNRLLAVGTVYDTTYVEKPRAPGGNVVLYDLKTHKPKYTLKGHKEGINALAWSPDGRRIASVSDDRTVRIWTLVR